MKGTVEEIEYVPPTWFRVRVKELKKPIMIHTNWFLSRDGLYRGSDGLIQTIIKPGDRISFDIAPPAYPTDKDHLYVRNLEVIRSEVIEPL